MPPLSWFLAAAGCVATAKIDESDVRVTTPTTSATDTDTDTDADADTDTDADADADADTDTDADADADTDTEPAPGSLRLEVRHGDAGDEPWVRVTRVTTDGDWIAPEETVAQGVVEAGEAVLMVPPPDPADLEPMDGAMGAIYLVSGWSDVDGAEDPNEPVDGVSSVLVAWFDGFGWLGFALVGAAADPVEIDLALGVDVSPFPNPEALSFEGVAAAVPPRSRLASVSTLEGYGALPDRPIDQELAASWEVHVEGPLAATRTEIVEGAELGVEVLYALLDVNGDDAAGEGDVPIGVVCADGAQAAAAWLTPTADPTVALRYALYGLHGGWTLITGLDDVVVEVADGTVLDVQASDACR